LRQAIELTLSAPAPRLSAAPPLLGRLGLALAPLLALTVWLLLPEAEGMSGAARATAAVGVLMVGWWMTEALPLPVTSLLPIVLFPLLGACSLGEALVPYASEVIFLFLGGFILALGVERWGLHRRLALGVLTLAGVRARRLLLGFIAASGLLSMWINNTATAVMMLPIGLSVLRLVEERVAPTERARWEGLGPALMLGIAYGSSVGSLGTLVGTAPNLLLRGFLARTYGLELGFGSWMIAALPLSWALLWATWAVLCRLFLPDASLTLPGGEALVREERKRAGPFRLAEWMVLAVFLTTALGWVLREPVAAAWGTSLPLLLRLSDAGLALLAAVTLFVLPSGERGRAVMDWESAQRLPWGTLLLFGGGLSLAAGLQRSGLDALLGKELLGLGQLPPWVLVLGVVAVVVVLTELTSNTAVTATFLPLLAAFAESTGTPPLLLLVPATLAATCAFMMPVATPPNAIVFASGRVSLAQMARVGAWLNLAAILLIALFAFTTARWLAP
jgi:solute carrier family 13 (sodium-dependent dicarboxylate transporter), member 2/3/5